MRVSTLRISNFRSVRNASLECDVLTLLIGRNGAGKSNFLRALEAFYNVSAPITEEDFFGRVTSNPIEIRVTYADLGSEELDEFATYTQDGTLTVTKRITVEGDRVIQRYYGTTLQLAAFAAIRRRLTKSERLAAWRDLVSDGSIADLQGTARSADQVEQLMAAYESNHPAMLQAFEREEQFFGPANIGGGKLDKHTKFVFIPAVREALDEVRGGKGAVHQILGTLVLRRLALRADVREFRREFRERAHELFGPSTRVDLEAVATSLSGSLATFAPGSSLALSWGEMAVPEVQPPPAKVTVVEDGFPGDIDRKGHGLQRALVLTLLRELALLGTRETFADETDQQADLLEVESRTRVPDLILAIEEPELFLHPSRCRYLAQLLLDLSADPGEGQPRNQVMYTTHSPHFVRNSQELWIGSW